MKSWDLRVKPRDIGCRRNRFFSSVANKDDNRVGVDDENARLAIYPTVQRILHNVSISRKQDNRMLELLGVVDGPVCGGLRIIKYWKARLPLV